MAVLRKGLWEEVAAAREAFHAAELFPHGVLESFCSCEVFDQVREELFSNVMFHLKESDLFRLYQSIDLANLEAESEQGKKIPGILQVRDALYSDSFRQLISEITGCGELTDEIDCSANNYAPGGHLLCHDDVIGTRRVAYIIYFTDPSEAWDTSFGGNLEMYPVGSATPSKTIPPSPNTMALFTVTPGKSFHSVQEVFAQDKPRISISGWFHTAQAVEDTNSERFEAQANPFPYLSFDSSVFAQDIRSFINPLYMEDGILGRIASQFEEESSIVLYSFLHPSFVSNMQIMLSASDESAHLGSGNVPSYLAGVGNGWTVAGPPHMQRYLRLNSSQAVSPFDCQLALIQRELFQSNVFKELLQRMTALLLTSYRTEIRRFRPGLDYTIAHQGLVSEDTILEATMCFVNDGSSSNLWESEQVGGFQCFVEVEDGDESDKSDLLTVTAKNNALTLVLRDEGVIQFIKYVNSQAPGSRYDIACQYITQEE